MTYKVSIRECPDHLRVEVSGERIPGREADDAIDVWKQIAETCRDTGLYRVMIIADIPGRLPAAAGNRIALSLEHYGLTTDYKMALVHLHGEALISNRLAETIVVNRGFWIKLFDNEDDAREWLLKEQGNKR